MSTDKNNNKNRTIRSFEVNLHYVRMKAIKLHLIHNIRDLFFHGYKKITIIHGFRHGKAIKSYLLNDLKFKFSNFYNDCQIDVIPDKKNLGRTHIYLFD